MSSILVYVETAQAELDDMADPLIAIALEISKALEARIIAVTLGRDQSHSLKALGEMGVDEVYVGEHPLLEWYNPEVHGRVLGDLIEKIRPTIVLMGHTYVGMDLGAVLAFRLGVPFINNCADLRVEAGEIIAIRPYYRGRISARIVASRFVPGIISLEKGFTAELPTRTNGTPSVHRLEVAYDEISLKQRVLEVHTAATSDVDISKAETIVSVGRGIGEKANIQLVRDLAEAMGGVLACSRPLVDMGWLPLDLQIGLSGRICAPKLYVACGISGAIEHLVGMKGSGVVVAINKDPEAPIFNMADFGIVGDILEILPALRKAVLAHKRLNISASSSSDRLET